MVDDDGDQGYLHGNLKVAVSGHDAQANRSVDRRINQEKAQFLNCLEGLDVNLTTNLPWIKKGCWLHMQESFSEEIPDSYTPILYWYKRQSLQHKKFKEQLA